MENTETNFQNWKQSIFNTIAPALLKQNTQSLGKDGKCKYRGDNGNKCAIGFLIKDEAYQPDIEFWGLYHKKTVLALQKSGVFDGAPFEITSDENHYFKNNPTYFLRFFQIIHDEYTPEYWYRELVGLAKQHCLDFSCIYEFESKGDLTNGI